MVRAADIEPISTQEAAEIAQLEADNVLALLEQLDGDDWAQPTDCTEWNVRDMTAHLAGSCAGYASWRDFFSQYVFNPAIMRADVPVDPINDKQLAKRKGRSPQALVEEFRETAPKAVRTRKNLPSILRKIKMPAGPPIGTMSVSYLMDVIYPRDQWMHRMDICRATGKEFVITPEHDKRLLDLVMLDIDNRQPERDHALKVNISGAVTASYTFGEGVPQAELTIDFFMLHRRSSGRATVEEVLESVTITGDAVIGERFLKDCEVLY